MSLPLRPSATGSANPAASLSSLWAYMSPALDHIVKSPTNNTEKAPAIDLDFYAGIHSACYNYITSQTETFHASTSSRGKDPDDGGLTSGTDLYDQLDRYFAQTARELLLGAPEQDDSTLIHYIIPCFARYSSGAKSVNRLLNYVNRHYVKRAVDEDKGWLSISDVLESVVKTVKVGDTREQLAKRLREKRVEELKKWGYVEGSQKVGEGLAEAEACAEAASSPDRIIHISALAHRRFRTDFLEPLLTVPKIGNNKHKVKKKIPKSNGTIGPPPNQPKGRLARAVKEMLESKGGDEEKRLRDVEALADMLRKVGVRPDHPLRKRLDKFCTSTVVTTSEDSQSGDTGSTAGEGSSRESTLEANGDANADGSATVNGSTDTTPCDTPKVNGHVNGSAKKKTKSKSKSKASS